MDSCNSGSKQSSSGGGGGGGDDEYDASRVDSIPSFLINLPSSSNYNNYNSPSYLNTFSQPQEPNKNDHHPLSNIGQVWSNNLESIMEQPTYSNPTTTLKGQPISLGTQGQLGHFSTTTMSIRPCHQNGTGINMKKSNPKKRTRASKRAPTTILTADASNFRAMVQEFTGIPAPPFSSPNSSVGAYSYDTGRLGMIGSGVVALRPRLPFLNPSPPPIVNQEMFNMNMQNNDQMMPTFRSLLLQHPPRPSNFNARTFVGTDLQRNLNVDDANDNGSSSRGGGGALNFSG